MRRGGGRGQDDADRDNQISQQEADHQDDDDPTPSIDSVITFGLLDQPAFPLPSQQLGALDPIGRATRRLGSHDRQAEVAICLAVPT